jgi:hypothetical protein
MRGSSLTPGKRAVSQHKFVLIAATIWKNSSDHFPKKARSFRICAQFDLTTVRHNSNAAANRSIPGPIISMVKGDRSRWHCGAPCASTIRPGRLCLAHYSMPRTREFAGPHTATCGSALSYCVCGVLRIKRNGNNRAKTASFNYWFPHAELVSIELMIQAQSFATCLRLPPKYCDALSFCLRSCVGPYCPPFLIS